MGKIRDSIYGGHRRISTMWCIVNILQLFILSIIFLLSGFPDSSAGKESACNWRDPSSIPGLGRSAEDGIGYSVQYSWASPVAQLVKNLPAMQETWVQSLSWEDPLEKGQATDSSILTWRIPWIVHGVTKSQTQQSNFHFTSVISILQSRTCDPMLALQGLEQMLTVMNRSQGYPVSFLMTQGCWRALRDALVFRSKGQVYL